MVFARLALGICVASLLILPSPAMAEDTGESLLAVALLDVVCSPGDNCVGGSTVCEFTSGDCDNGKCKAGQTWTVDGEYKGTDSPAPYTLTAGCGDDPVQCNSDDSGKCNTAAEDGGAGEDRKCYVSWDANPGHAPDYNWKCLDPVNPTEFVEAVLVEAGAAVGI